MYPVVTWNSKCTKVIYSISVKTSVLLAESLECMHFLVFEVYTYSSLSSLTCTYGYISVLTIVVSGCSALIGS